MGSKYDLPQKLKQFITQENGLILIDYPLAPFTKHQTIIRETSLLIKNIIKTHNIKSYSFMGRSSGANLIVSLPVRELNLEPKYLILFYGYASKISSWMDQPVQNISISADLKDIKNWLENANYSTNRSIKNSYYYYLGIRQHGLWRKVLDFKNIPIQYERQTPCFIFHSIFDPDVPYKCSLDLKDYFENSTIHSSTLRKHACDHDEKELDILLEKLNHFLNGEGD